MRDFLDLGDTEVFADFVAAEAFVGFDFAACLAGWGESAGFVDGDWDASGAVAGLAFVQ